MANNQSTVQSAAPKSSSPSNAESWKPSDPRRVLACGTCRKRKLKCDSKRPKCSTCARLGHPCEYDEVRKKSGPKRGYVKELEARLKQVETLLTTHQNDQSPPQSAGMEKQPLFPAGDAGMNMFNTSSTNVNGLQDMQQDADMVDPSLNMNNTYGMGGIDDFNWDMVSLGLEEPLPPQDVMDDLYQAYFERIHPSLPMVHKPRFLASLNMPTNQRPPVCLRYMMWAHACAVLPQYKSSAEHFYQKARKYIEQDEMKGHGEFFISVAHAQAWILIATYEFKTLYFPRAWMSSGRSTRICQLMGLHRQDRVGLDVKQTMAPPKDWIEREERRRTFWMAYNTDRYASIGTGWPMVIDERDILTNLPASEEAFLTGKSEPTPALADVLAGEGTSGLSSFAGVCLLATLFGRNLTHLHRPADDDNDHDLNGEFWKRHRSIDNILLNTSLSLPAHLRLPYGLQDPNIIFANMNIHTSTICLHQAAIFKADKHHLPNQIGAESKRRCIVAADQITNIMKMCSHQDLSRLNPFLAFCLYVAARVFVQYLKSKQDDSTVRASLTFLLSAMMALRNKNPLTETFLVQLDVDLEGSGLNIPSPLGPNRYVNRPVGEYPANTDAVKCSPLFEIRESQSLGQQARGVETVVSSQLDTDIDFASMGYAPLSHHSVHQNQHQYNGVPVRTKRMTPVAHSSDSPQQSSFRDLNQAWDQAFGNVVSSTDKSPAELSPGQSNGSSYSNQPTPSASNNSNSSHTSFSPHQADIDIDNMQPFFSNYESKPRMGFPAGPFVPGILLGPSLQKTGSSDTNFNGQTAGRQINSDNFRSSTIDNDPYPTGETKYAASSGTEPASGHTGLTPAPTGYTPGPTGMTPTNWNDMQMNENTEWMYGD